MPLIGTNPPRASGGFILRVGLEDERVPRLCIILNYLLQLFESELSERPYFQLLVPGVMLHVALNLQATAHNLIDPHEAIGTHGELQRL